MKSLVYETKLQMVAWLTDDTFDAVA